MDMMIMETYYLFYFLRRWNGDLWFKLQLREPRMSISSLGENLPHFHENFAQLILASSISSVTPEGVILSVLNQFPVSSAQQKLLQVWMLGELAENSFKHHIYTHLLPVCANALAIVLR